MNKPLPQHIEIFIMYQAASDSFEATYVIDGISNHGGTEYPMLTIEEIAYKMIRCVKTRAESGK